MKKFFLLILAVLVVLVSGTKTFAGIIGSPHDIAAQKYSMPGIDPESKNVCNYCHVPHKAKGATLWATAPPSLKGWGRVGPLCYSCHDGVTIVSPNVDASQTVFNPKSHGLNLSELPAGDDVSGSGLPYTNGSQDNIECSTCHNPHDDTIRPFLRVNMVDLCEKCHKNRENSGFGINNAEGTHPVHKLPKDETEGPSPIFVIPDFKVPFPLPYPSADGKDTDGVHWTLGGHLSKGNDGTIECVTCHSIHGKAPTGPYYKLLSVDPVKDNSDHFCEGCHRGQRADKLPSPPYPNPGGTIVPRSYHPADDDICNGKGRIVQIKEPDGWVFGKNGEVLCTTCHKPHGSIKNSPILRPDAASATFCESCHSVPFPHHPVGDISGGNLLNSGEPHASTRQITIPSTFPAGITYGKPVNGNLYCSSCHRAHNASCTPILVIDCTKGDACDICAMCHPKFNPTWQTDDNWKGTHFLGDPTASRIDYMDVYGNVTPDGQAGYYDQYPPSHIGKWPESGLISEYGGPSGKEMECCSCHNFGVGNITAGNADQSPYLGPTLAPGFQTQDLVSGLLARAGSFKEWLPSDVQDYIIGGDRGSEERTDKYLCTGCHGLTPRTNVDARGEGFTHPLMNADASAMTDMLPPATATFNKHVNCESCHTVHEADSRGGFLVLKRADLKDPTEQNGLPDPYRIRTLKDIEFAPLCQLCHIGY
ncbi:MAG: cytochrome c3 family protein [Nitrospirota bacterium]